MKTLFSFLKKEFLELSRTGKLVILLIIFILFGIMNPAIAKLTPWLMETMAGSLAEAGFAVTAVEVNALTSWTQFYKNIPLALIVFLLMFSGVFAGEYQKGTLVNMLTKGLSRWKVVLSKAASLTAVWSVCYWLCYGITYGYNAYFWEKSVASHTLFSAFCFYLFGLWLISLLVLGSTLLSSASGVLMGAGAGFVLVYLAGMLPKVKPFLPIKLMDSPALLTDSGALGDFSRAIFITAILIIFNIAAGVFSFNKKAI